VSDTIGAVSLLLAAVGVLYGVWYPEIRDASLVVVPDHLDDARPQREQVGEALRHRARPLFWSVTVLALILVPDSIRIAVGSTFHILREGFGAILDFDATQAALLAILAFLIVFSIHLHRQVTTLKVKLKQMTT